MTHSGITLRISRLLTLLGKIYRYGIANYSWLIVCLTVLACSASLVYTLKHLGFNTDTTEMLSPELPFHQNRIRFWQTFPQDVKSILVVVDAEAPEKAKKIVDQLAPQLRGKGDIIESVYLPGAGQFFEEQGFLFLDTDELENLADTLANSQPVLAKLVENYSLSGLLEPLGNILVDQDNRQSLNLNPVLAALNQAFENARAGKLKPVSWQKLLTGGDRKLNSVRRFLIVKAKLDYSQLFPAQPALELVRSLAQSIALENPDVRIRMTGETALQHEELESVSKGSAISAILSLVLVCATLLLGLRSVKLMAATLFTLIAGLLLTAGYATVIVGHLNMISIAFAVLYIGLGVDYAIHLCLHYREAVEQGRAGLDAIFSSIKAVGTSLVLCAITSAVGFYAYIPTSYSGVSELGIISGTSMFIGLFLTLTFLPALLKLMKATVTRRIDSDNQHITVAPNAELARWNRNIRWASLVLAVLAAAALPQVTFDFDPVHLRDTGSESVQTYYDLVRDPDTSPLTLTLLESDPARMNHIVDRIKNLPTVDKVITIKQFVPGDQDNKLEVIEQMSLVLGPLTASFPKTAQNDRQIKAFEVFDRKLVQALGLQQNSEFASELAKLHEQFDQFKADKKSKTDKQTSLKIFEQNLLDYLPLTVQSLQNNLKASAFELEQIPSELRERWLSPNGIYRIQIFPKQDISKLQNLKAFVESVQAIAPKVTDLPVIYLEAGNEVVKAFQQALLTALVAIIMVLLVVLRSVRDTIFVLIPLILAAMLTCAASVVLGLPFNFANIIAVPLLFGLGVDSGIHIMHSIRSGAYIRSGLMGNVTSRAIVYSALTTIFSFSSLAFSSHSGTASMGILLAIGISMMLFCTLIVLPAFVEKNYQHRS